MRTFYDKLYIKARVLAGFLSNFKLSVSEYFFVKYLSEHKDDDDESSGLRKMRKVIRITFYDEVKKILVKNNLLYQSVVKEYFLVGV